MDSRERAALNKAVGAAMDAVNEKQDAAIADLAAKVKAQGAEIAKLRKEVVDLKIAASMGKKAKE